jgi:acetoin utilization protein AcuC
MAAGSQRASTISGINRLSPEGKRQIYRVLIPNELLVRYRLAPDLLDKSGRELLRLNCPEGSVSTEMELRHEADFPDPILYGHIADTLNGQVHVLLYILNDPASPRFDVDRMPDGSSTTFGTVTRNLLAEAAAMAFGLAPGQIRRGLRMLPTAIEAFERFVASLGHDMYFAEPLYYHNAVIFERYGFAYQQGRRLMERIQAGFTDYGDLLARLDGSTVFRTPGAGGRIRLRSWAIHDNLLGEPFRNVTMYKRIGKTAGVNTCPNIPW